MASLAPGECGARNAERLARRESSPNGSATDVDGSQGIPQQWGMSTEQTSNGTAIAERPAKRKRANARGKRTKRVSGDVILTGGKPTRCTPAMAERMAGYLRKGVTLKAACAKVGIHHETVKQWLAKGYGEKECPDNAPYAHFVEILQTAKADLQERCLDNLGKLADGGFVTGVTEKPDGTVSKRFATPDRQANTWLLERVVRGPFSPVQRIEHTGTVRHESVSIAVQVDDGRAAALVSLLCGPAQENAPAADRGKVIEVDRAAD